MKNRCMGPKRSLRARAFALVIPILTAGCGNLTVGGVGEATVAVTGNEPAPQPAPSASWAAASEPLAPTSHDDDEADEAEGEVEVEFLVSLVSETGSEVRLGDEEIRVRVDLQGVVETDVVKQLVPAVRYTELRLVFTEISAEVEAGLLINGIPIVGELRVELEDVSLLVTRPIDLDVADGQQVRLLVDLNAPAWLTAVDPITLTVDETVFAALVNVVIP